MGQASFAAIEGIYEGHEFTVNVDAQQTYAQIIWKDGTPGVTLPVTNTPSRTFRCPCVYFESYPRLLAIQFRGPNSGSASYYRLD